MENRKQLTDFYFREIMNFLTKIIFSLKKPRVIIVAGNAYQSTGEAIFQVLKHNFKTEKISTSFYLKSLFKNKILVVGAGLQQVDQCFIKKSKLPILVVTNIGDIPSDKDFFTGEKAKTKEIIKLAESLPSRGYLILNFDDETARELKNKTRAHSLTFGFQERADFRATDVFLTQFPSFGTNFKLNYQGNIVPIWLKNIFGKEQIYASLASVAAGTILDLNLVEISESLKLYQGLRGRMRLIKGIKNSMILDDSESATPFSMTEALEVLGELEGFERKIAVLGDIIGIGKYTIEAHEALGERVAKSANDLFTFGLRAKFIAQGALEKGMIQERIFQFNTIDEGKLKLQDEIRDGDLILVDGSKEMKMGRIVEEIKA